MNRTYSLLLILALTVATVINTGCSAESQSKDNDDKDSTTAIPVEIASVDRGDVSAYYTGTATLEAEDEATVVAKVKGVVQKLEVEEGDRVKAGDVLARLEDEQLRIEMKRAEATMNKLYNDFQRNKELYNKKLISAEQFDNSRFEYESQKAAYELAKLDVEHAVIKAPISGVVSERMIKTGNMVKVNDPVFRVTDFQPLLAVLHVPEHEMNKLKLHQPTLLSVDAQKGETFQGHIERISPVVDPNTGTFKVTVSVSDASGRLKPGMFGRIKIVYDVHKQTVTVPKDAVISEDDLNSVFVIKDKVAFKRAVNTGYINGTRIEILSGLEPGEQVVTTGQSSLKDSAMVDIVNF